MPQIIAEQIPTNYHTSRDLVFNYPMRPLPTLHLRIWEEGKMINGQESNLESQQQSNNDQCIAAGAQNHWPSFEILSIENMKTSLLIRDAMWHQSSVHPSTIHPIYFLRIMWHDRPHANYPPAHTTLFLHPYHN